MTWLVINPERLAFAIGPGHDVYIQLQYPHEQTGLVPGTELAIQLTPAQARGVASRLLQKADEAEAARRQAQDQQPK